jgi:2-phosphoxylose phosphatase
MAANLAWYAPNTTAITNLTTVLNGTGVFGFIFNTSNTPDHEYGIYNWCNMPHVRRQEYPVPSADYRLKYVEIIHRHHKRTPYASNAFPIEPYPWNCNDEGLFYYGQPLPQTGKSNKAAHTYWDVYTSSVNPFFEGGFNGSCEFPQITGEGLDDSAQHGRDLYGVYHDLLHFLPSQYDNNTVAFRVTNNVITSQVAGMVTGAMFSESTSSNIPLQIQQPNVDSLEPTYSCPTKNTLASAIRNSTSGSPWETHLTDPSTIALYSALDRLSGVSPSDSDWHVSFDHYFDNLSARLCHQKQLPCNSSLPSPNCVTEDQANAVFRRGEYEYAYTWRLDSRSLAAATSGYGVWLAELAQNMLDTTSGRSSIKYRHNVAHDGSVSPVLAFLQVDEMVWPGMGAEVVFELWQGKGGEEYLRVLWGGKILRSSSPQLGLMDMIPLTQWLDYVYGLVGMKGSKIVGLCNG